MEKETIVRDETLPIVKEMDKQVMVGDYQTYPLYNDEQGRKLVDEVIAAFKDERMNIKRSISADIASTARVQKQNEQVIQICERELRRGDLSEERRDELIATIKIIAESTTHECSVSREFQNNQLDQLHKLPWIKLGLSALLVIAIVGGRALRRVVA